MRILVTGANGQLAGELCFVLKNNSAELGNIDIVYSTSQILYADKSRLDITRLEDVIYFVKQYRPHIVINCAAYTNVDKCESDFENAFKVNSIGPRNLAMACEKVSARLVHISTDYVFNGIGNVPFREYDTVSPASVYGKTKLLGEQYVRENCRKYFIVRTSWLYGIYGKNFVYTILKAAEEKRYLEVVNDQIGNPTNAQDLVYHILRLMLTEEYGIYHCTGNGECSWYDFASEIIKCSGIKCSIIPINSFQLQRPAKRPEYSSLDNMMLRCTIGDKMRQWQDALKSFIENCEMWKGYDSNRQI
jgi:dTDP-4-dehydrorhamnose reductase